MAEKVEPAEHAARLHNALKGGHLNENKAIHEVAGLDPFVLEQVRHAYGEAYGNSLVLDIQKHVSGHFGEALVASLLDPDEYDATLLYHAMKGLGTADHILIEVLATRTPDHIKKIKEAFVKKYGESLDKWLIEETSGDYRKYLEGLASGEREPANKPVNKEKVTEDIDALYKAGEGKLGTNESVFIEIFSERSWKHLRLVIEGYGKSHKHSLETAIKNEFSGNLEKALLWSIESIENRHAFFARRLNKAIVGLGTNDKDLVRIMVSRRHNDLWEISEEYNTLFRRSLKEDICGDTSGDYQKLLVEMIKEA